MIGWARVAALANPGEVVVSQTIRDIVIGSTFQFTPRGRHELKGVPGTWEIFGVAS
jgi:class 3 adenylate cyclase